MKRIFISTSDNRVSDAEIRRMIEFCEIKYGKDFYIVNSILILNDEAINPISLHTEDYDSLKYLAVRLTLLNTADAAIFVDGWQNTRGCVIEHMCCEKYDIEILRD